jgi:acetyl esterase
MPLDPEAAALLELQAASGAPPRSAMSIARTREFYRKMRALAGEPPALSKVEDRAVGAEGRQIPIRLYQPSLAAGLPVLLYLHGGRFISGDLETHDPVCRSLAAAAGCPVVAVDYRLAPEHRFPAALEDCYAVAAWLAQNGAGRLAVCGDSAGGNLAAATALLARERGGPRLVCQVLIYPMLDATCSLPSHVEYASGYGPGSEDMKRGYREYAPAGIDPTDPRLSPLFAAELGGLPPALILTAEYDSLRDDGEEYARRLEAAGVEVVLMRYEGAMHGFFQMAGVLTTGRRAVADTAGYLRRVLGSRPV